MRWLFLILAFIGLSGCNLSDRGISKIQVVDELFLGTALDEIKSHWFLYSTKRFQLEQARSDESTLVYRGVSRDQGVTSFYLFFNIKTKTLVKVEWRYHSSMTNIKEVELLELWTKKLWKPSYHRGWDGRSYSWTDRKARLELYLSEGICQLIHRLN